MATTFNQTQQDYPQVAPWLWDPAGMFTVRRTAPRPGERVLDACCGIGSSAVPAAAAVAPSGSVDAVDLAGALLAHGRSTAKRLDLTNIDFIEADVTTWTAKEPYDVVQCVFGVFLLPDLDRDTTHLIGLARPGGRIGVTVWAKGALETFGRTLFEVLAGYRPETADRPRSAGVIERINTEPLLHAWLDSLGLRDISVHRDTRQLSLTPDTAWGLVTGSGFRGVLAGMDQPTITDFRADLLTALADRRIDLVDASTLTAVGHRPDERK
jgi:trans-aconitate methyltransferase